MKKNHIFSTVKPGENPKYKINESSHLSHKNSKAPHFTIIPKDVSGLSADKKSNILERFKSNKCPCKQQHMPYLTILEDPHFYFECEKTGKFYWGNYTNIKVFDEFRGPEKMSSQEREKILNHPNLTIATGINESAYNSLDSDTVVIIDDDINPMTCTKKDLELCTVCKHAYPIKQFKKCGNCRLKRYCGKECQCNDWPIHKKKCKNNIERSITSTPHGLKV
jgi:hypothetical protein